MASLADPAAAAAAPADAAAAAPDTSNWLDEMAHHVSLVLPSPGTAGTDAEQVQELRNAGWRPTR